MKLVGDIKGVSFTVMERQMKKILMAFGLLFAMNVSAADVEMKIECDECETDTQFINKAMKQTNKNGAYNIYISNFKLGVIKKVRYIKSVTYDKIGDPVDLTKAYIVAVEPIYIDSMNTYLTYSKKVAYILTERQVPEFITPSVYNVIVDSSTRNAVEAYYSQWDDLLEMTLRVATSYFTMTNRKPSVEMIFSDKSRAIFRIDDVSYPTLRFTLTLVRAIDKFGNSLPISPSSYNDMGVLNYPSSTEPDIEKAMSNAMIHGLNVVDVRPTNHTGSVGTGGNGGGRTICYTIRLSGAVNASIFKCMAT
ncbi:hypothetical protein JD504_08110 [Aeromonas hydrophila]|nr:hypothetical protein [Aeromonas hydrophila]